MPLLSVGAFVCVDATGRQSQTLDWAAMNEVFRDDLFRIAGMGEPIPDLVRVYGDNGGVLALVEATCFVDAHCVFEAGGFHGVLQRAAKLLGMLVGTGGPRRGLVALVQANEKMMFIEGHVE